MSEQAAEQEAPPEAIELPPTGDAAFASLMDTLVSDDGEPAAAEGKPAGGAAAPADGQPAAAGEAAGAATPPAADSTDGAAGKPAVPGDGEPAKPAADAPDPKAVGAAEPGGDLPAAWTAEAADLTPRLGELSVKFEENTALAYQNAALVEVQKDHKPYFDALNQHPRTLVGKQVPAIGKEGMETLKDSADASEWQEAVKALLVGEVRDRASRTLEENSTFLTTVHASIELFQNNMDLIPGTKNFDVELAKRFAELATPYEVRKEEKLIGYSIPVQPIINQLRSGIAAERTKSAAESPPAAAAGAVPDVAAAPAADPPQAGVASKAGDSSKTEDFSTLFGTIGLPNLRI